jgi:acyl-coenzyme A synthetase/AMP-(fatty) acid ligase
MKADRADNVLVARESGQERIFSRFREDVSLTAGRIMDRQIKKAVLSTEDSYSCAVGFLASLHSGCRIIIPPNNLPGMLENFVGENCPHLSNATYSGNSFFIPTGGRGKESITFEKLDPAKCELDFFTSGSTGAPKKISKTIFQIEEELKILQSSWGDCLAGATTLGTVSHQHIFGLYFRVLWPLSAGRPFVSKRFEIWEEMLARMSGKSLFISSPAHLSRIPPIEPLKGKEKPTMIFSAGGPLDHGSARSARKIFGVLPMEIFGSTETGGIAFRQQETPATLFEPMRGVKTRVDETGLLSVKSGYTEGQNWVETNDIADLHEDGRFLLTGRANQFVKIEGKRISIAEVEKYLLRSELVSEAFVLVVKDNRESLAAAVELSEAGWRQHEKVGAFRMNRHLRHFLAMYLESAALPRRWRFVQKLPVNSQGKRIQNEINELFET